MFARNPSIHIGPFRPTSSSSKQPRVSKGHQSAMRHGCVLPSVLDEDLTGPLQAPMFFLEAQYSAPVSWPRHTMRCHAMHASTHFTFQSQPRHRNVLRKMRLTPRRRRRQQRQRAGTHRSPNALPPLIPIPQYLKLDA